MIDLPVIQLHLHPEIAVACGAAIAAAFTLLGLLVMMRAHRRLRLRSEALDRRLGALRDDLTQAEAAGAGAIERMHRLEQAYGRLSERLRFVERRADGRSFDQAIDSARHGTESGKLAEQFGLSRGEAELVARMHGRPKSA